MTKSYYNPNTHRNNYAITNIREEAQYLEKVLSVMESQEAELKSKLECYEFAIEYLRTTDINIYNRFMNIVNEYKSIPF